MPGAELALRCEQPSENIETAGKKTLPAMGGQGEDGFGFFNHFSRLACCGSQHPGGVFSDLSIPQGSSEPLWVRGGDEKFTFAAVSSSLSVAGFGNRGGPGEAAAADVSRKEPGRPRGLFAKQNRAVVVVVTPDWLQNAAAETPVTFKTS